jgi:hypothetical protein
MNKNNSVESLALNSIGSNKDLVADEVADVSMLVPRH